MRILQRTTSLFLLAAFLLATPSIQAKGKPSISLTTTQLYATSGATLYRVDQNTGALTTVGDLGVSISSLTYDANHDVLYGLGYADGYKLYAIDRRHAKVRLIGSLSDGGVIAYDGQTGVFYLGAGFQGLYVLNPRTAELTPLGGHFPQLSGLAFDAQGGAWGCIDAGPIGGGYIFTIDVANAKFGGFESFMGIATQTICFEPLTGHMYGVLAGYHSGGNEYTLTYFPFDQNGVGENRISSLPGPTALAFAIDGLHIVRIP